MQLAACANMNMILYVKTLPSSGTALVHVGRIDKTKEQVRMTSNITVYTE